MKGKVAAILGAVLFVYLVLGGVAFHFLESNEEESSTADFDVYVRDLLDDYPCLTRKDLEALVQRVQKARDEGVSLGDEGPNWDMYSSIFFAVTIVTTIGYGNISPVTNGGRVFCVFFAIFGIPLFLVLASVIGKKQVDLGDRIYKKAQCKGLEGKPKVMKTLAALLVFFVGFLLFMLIPAIIFNNIEEWNLRESLYYTYITLTTIGFGDFVAGTGDYTARGFYRLCVAAWILLGLSWMAGLISIAQDAFSSIAEREGSKVADPEQPANEKKEDDRDIAEQTSKEKS